MSMSKMPLCARLMARQSRRVKACITVPYETNAEEMAKGLALENEDASKKILKMLEDALKKREKEGRLGNVPVTDIGRTDCMRARKEDAQSASGT